MKRRNSTALPQVTITVNGPGEVAGWLQPLVSELRKRQPLIRICVAVVPCVYSTGLEYDLIRSQTEIDAVCTAKETMSLVFRNRLPPGFHRNGSGFVLHLGGDSVLTLLLARRLGQPCLAYVEKPIPMETFFAAVFYSGIWADSRVAKSNGKRIIGDMMIDAAMMHCRGRLPARSGLNTVGLYPGSRDYLVKFVLPFYAAVAEKLKTCRTDIEWLLAKSDFLAGDFLRDIPDVNDGRRIEGVNLSWLTEAGREYVVTPTGIRIEILPHGAVAARAKLVLTLPGSNTAELAALGVPMIITIPSWKSELIPWPGLTGHVDRIPFIGKYIKRAVGHLIYRSIGYAAHPNRRIRSMVVPELVGHIRTGQVVDLVRTMLDSDLRPLEDKLRAVMGPPGATGRLVTELQDFLAGDNA
ncbi:MAG: hypothetical protein JW950_03705 [Deltaproteobacteria bacterium]|nr:hypothetical protein [Deltaproteobacteria bacterium]